MFNVTEIYILKMKVVNYYELGFCRQKKNAKYAELSSSFNIGSENYQIFCLFFKFLIKILFKMVNKVEKKN